MKKQNNSGGIFVVIILLLLISCDPLSYYIGEWHNSNVQDTNSFTIDDNSDVNAYRDCYTRARALLKAPEIFSAASSTKGDFETYDCYALKLNKI